jgi:hypothetical protein
MPPKSTTLSGRCHCGNISIVFESSLPIGQLPVRACSCSFCRAHGARSTSDPNGRVEIAVRDPAQLIRYRFATKTAEFLLCGRCGVYAAAVLTSGNSSYAIVNVNALDASTNFTQEVRSMNYDGETEAERIQRRRANWTPAVLKLGKCEP